MGYLIYIDESYDRKDKYAIMAGFITPINKWKEIDNGIKRIKNDIFAKPDMNLKAIRRQKYDDHKIWKNLSVEEKNKFNEEFYNLICGADSLVLASLIDKEKMKKTNKELFFFLAYGFILQRYQYFLSEKNSYGFVIMDKAQAKAIKRLYQEHKEFLDNGLPVIRADRTIIIQGKEKKVKGYKKLRLSNICENLIFLDDDHTNLLQIIDIIAAGISGKFNRKNKVWFEKISPIIRSGPNGQIEGYGLKFFPSK